MAKVEWNIPYRKGDFVSYVVEVSNGIQPNLQEIFHLIPEENIISNRASVIGGVVGGCLGIIVAVVLSVFLLKRKYNCSIKMSTKEDIKEIMIPEWDCQ
ncbi:hypothetical protein MAR_021686 [Mya arenaria]|uniref:Uncharacterized protein n=1 Tax=Mya arenaria TaxID=6604 RepID=A0ABY7EBK9_MYAAR|nr:hypothetical protein MAR_021686 [Mya arenaria]